MGLSMTAVRQILMSSRSRGKTNSSVPQDEATLLQEIEAACNKFDTSKSGLMSEMDVVSVLSYVNISCQHDKIVSICSNLPRNRTGKMRIEEFLNMPILSEEAFNALDRNKDGFITKGELKLANKEATMADVMQVIKDYDFDKDGKLNMAEYSQYKSESETEKGGQISAANKEEEKSDSSDEVVFIELGKK